MSVTSSNTTDHPPSHSAIPAKAPDGDDSTVARTASRVSDIVLAALEVQYPSIKDYNPVAPGADDRAHRAPAGKVTVYRKYFEVANFRLPATAFVVNVCEYFGIALSQLQPLGLMRVLTFEMFCRGHGGEPTVELLLHHFRVARQDCWFSFERRPSSSFTKSKGPTLRSWKDGFFFVDEECLPGATAASLAWNSGNIDSRLNVIPRDDAPDTRLFDLCKGASLHLRTYHQEALLFALGISSSWKRGAVRPVFVKDGQGMGAM